MWIKFLRCCYPLLVSFLITGITTAQTTPALESLATIRPAWESGDLEAVDQRWPQDSILLTTLTGINSPTSYPPYPLPPTPLDSLTEWAKFLSSTQSLLGRPDRTEYVWRAFLLVVENAPFPTDSLQIDIRGRLLRYPTGDEPTRDLLQEAANATGPDSDLYRRVALWTVMADYNDGSVERADSLLAALPDPAIADIPTDRREDEAFLLRMRGVAAMARTDYPAAQAFFRRAVDLQPTSSHAYQPRALLRLDLAGALRGLNRYAEAHAQLDSAALELERLRPELLPIRGELHLNRGRLYRAEEQLKPAIRSLERAAEHMLAYPRDHTYRGSLMLARSTEASLRRKRGDFHGAAELYRRCIELAELRREDNSLQLLGLNLNYAGVLGSLGNYAEGAERATTAKKLATQRFGPEHPYVAIALNIAAENLIGLGRFAEAQAAAEESLALRRKIYPAGHPRLRYPHVVLAQIAETEADYPTAIQHRTATLDNCRSNHGPDAAPCREFRLDYVQTLLLAGKTSAATAELTALEQAFPTERGILRAQNPAYDLRTLGLHAETLPPGPQRLRALDEALSRLDTVLYDYAGETSEMGLTSLNRRLFVDQVVTRLTVEPRDVRAAWETTARLKHNALLRRQAQRKQRETLLPPATLARLDALTAAVTQARSDYHRQGNATPAALDALNAADRTLAQFEDSLRQAFPATRAEQGRATEVNWQAIGAQLSEETTIVELLWTDTATWAFSWSTAQAPRVERLPAFPTTVADETFAVQAGATKPPPDEHPAVIALSKWLLELPGERLRVISDGPLSRLSLAALPTPDGDLLLNHKTIGYGLHLNDFARATTTTAPLPLHLVYPEEAQSGLPAQQSETRPLSERFKTQPENGQVWVSGTPERGVWHFATHGFADHARPANSYLMLPGRKDRLYLDELGVRGEGPPLVVLSACETGSGRWEAGEGVGSMARAFARAGAGATLTTLWEVPDAAAATITNAFYTHLSAGLRPSIALRQAQVDYLASVDDPSLRAPRYWAAFILTGADDVLELAEKTTFWPWAYGLLALGLLGLVAVLLRRLLTA